MAGKWRDVMCPTISLHSFKARGLKFGMYNPYINGSKCAKENFYLLFEAEIFKFKVM